MLSILWLLGQLCLATQDTSAAGVSYSFELSGYDGGGNQSCVAVDPFHAGVVLDGADISGFYRSTNYGNDWASANDHAPGSPLLFTIKSDYKVASIAFSKKTPNKVYAAVGNRGADGRFLVSTDGGESWEARSDVPHFSGGNTNAPDKLPNPHPRSTGNLIALDETNGFIYVATYKDGVMRSSDDGRTWKTIGLEGKFLRSLARDDQNPDIVYACAYGNGVWKTTDARGSGTFAKLANSPKTAEELIVIDRQLYAAAAGEGIWKSTDGGQTWTVKYAPVNPDAEISWCSIDGYAGEKGHVLYAGAWRPVKNAKNPTMYESIVRSTDGGEKWQPITVDPAKVHFTMGGPGGDLWWHSQGEIGEFTMIGKERYIPTYLAIDPLDKSRLYAAGRAGVWRTDNALADSPDWYPAVHKMNTTINKEIAVDPKQPNRVFVTDVDWVFVYSNDQMKHIWMNRPADLLLGTDIEVDPATTPSRVFLGVGADKQNSNGEIISIIDPSDPKSTWKDEGLSDCTGGKRPLGIALGQEKDGSPVLLAAVEDSGIWRRAAGVWTRVCDKAMPPQKTLFASFAWAPGSQFVYLYDRETGVWRSADRGLTWSKIWDQPSSQEATGYLALDPKNSKLYVSTVKGLYVLENPEGAVNPVLVKEVLDPGPIAFAGGSVYVTTRMTVKPGEERLSNPRPEACLLRSADGGKTWVNIADKTYRSAAGLPQGIAVAPDGRVYVSMDGTGVIVGTPSK